MSYLADQSGRYVAVPERRALRAMLGELESSRLEVTLAPSRQRDTAERGGMVRVVVDQNAPWYQRLCAAYPAHRKKGERAKFDTRIKRQDTIAAIRRVLSTHRASGFYADAVLAMVPWFVAEKHAEAAHFKREARKAKRKPPPSAPLASERGEFDPF